jgi:hypothetical protein
VLRRIFIPKMEEAAGGWRRLHNEELDNLDSSPNVIRVIKSGRMRWAGHVACMGGFINAYKILVGNLKGRELEKRSCRWDDNIRIDLGGNRMVRCGLDACCSG